MSPTERSSSPLTVCRCAGLTKGRRERANSFSAARRPRAAVTSPIRSTHRPGLCCMATCKAAQLYCMARTPLVTDCPTGGGASSSTGAIRITSASACSTCFPTEGMCSRWTWSGNASDASSAPRSGAAVKRRRRSSSNRGTAPGHRQHVHVPGHERMRAARLRHRATPPRTVPAPDARRAPVRPLGG